MNTDRLGKAALVSLAARAVTRNAVNDDGASVTTLVQARRRVKFGDTPSEPDSVEAAPDHLEPDGGALWPMLRPRTWTRAGGRLISPNGCLKRVPVVTLFPDEWRNKPPPAPVIWRNHAQFADAVLPVG